VDSVSEVLSIGTWRDNAELIADVARLPGYLEPERGDPWSVLDVTYGVAGGFWKRYRPATLVTNDLATEAEMGSRVVPVETDHHWSYLAIPLDANSFDVVVFDPPYKLNGTPALGEQDVRFGTTKRTSRDEVLTDMRLGAIECYRVARRRLFVKCMDQVEGGEMRWQTDLITRAIEDRCLCGHDRETHVTGVCEDALACGCRGFTGGRKMDRFDIPLAGREQPKDRKCPTCDGDGLDHTDGWSEHTAQPCLTCGGSKRVPIVQRTSRGKHSSLLVFAKPSRWKAVR